MYMLFSTRRDMARIFGCTLLIEARHVGPRSISDHFNDASTVRFMLSLMSCAMCVAVFSACYCSHKLHNSTNSWGTL